MLEKNHQVSKLRLREQQRLLAGILLRIRRFLHLEEILSTASCEVRELLAADRVIVYQFDDEMNGKIVAESVLPQWITSLNSKIQDTCFRETQGIAYRDGKVRGITDIYHAGLTACHINLLEQFEVKANLVVPILLNTEARENTSYLRRYESSAKNTTSQLWGLLIAHQCSQTREWETEELDLLQQLSVHLAVAIQQAQLFANLQTLNNSLEQKVQERTQELQSSEQRFRAIFDNTFQLTGLLTTTGILLEANQTALNFGGLQLEDVINKPFWETYWWTISPSTQERLKKAIARCAVGEFIRYEVDVLGAGGQIATLDFSLRPLKDESGQVIMLIPEGRDITERKQAEAKLQLQAQMLNEIHDAVVSTDLNCIIQTWNQGAQQLFGYTTAETIGQHISLLYFPEDLTQLLPLILQALLKNGSHETEIRNRTKSGEEIYINLRLSVMEDEDGNIIRLLGCSNDITERKKAEIALKKLNQELETRVERRTAALLESEQRFATLAAAATVAIFRLNSDSSCIYVNDYWCKMTGRTAEAALGYGWLETLHPEDKNRIYREWEHRPDKREFYQNEGRVLQPDGTIIWFYCQVLPETDSNGNFIGYIGTITDITERKQSEIALRESEEFNRSIFENNADCLKVLDLDGKIISMNQPGQALMEIDDFALVRGQEWVKFWPEAYHSAASQALKTAKSGDIGRFQGFRLTAKGNPKWWDVLVAAVYNPEGKPVRLIATSRDITANKIAEAEILRSRDLREAIFNESTDAIFLVDAETVKNIDCNQRAVEMFAAAHKSDLIGIEGNQLQKQQFTPEELTAIKDEINSQGFWSREIEYNTFNGNSFWGNLAAKQITVAGQKMTLVRVTDITQRKLAEAQLQKTNQQLAVSHAELARATRLKDQFLANMSHELRTPLNAILGISEALQDEAFGVISEKQRHGLQTIERSGKHLLELINDILDLSKIEAGQLELQYTHVSINSLCQASLAFIKQQAFQKSIQVELKIQTHLPDLFLDERRIRQVLINLLNNAVKFTPEGGHITLNVNRQQLASETEITSLQDFIRITVADTGIGIAPENLHKVFQAFVQIDSSLNRKYAGTGLGLALVKRLVEMHGGKVGVSSKLGVGSCFIVDLPCNKFFDSASGSVNQVLPELNSTFKATAENSPLILLAEDNEANIFTISSYLEAIGYHIILANNGAEAIALTKTKIPNLILMDIQMPKVDGLEAIQQIKSDPKFVNIPIIALTALAMSGDREKCLAAGANDYITKPIKLKQLATKIQQLLTTKELKK